MHTSWGASQKVHGHSAFPWTMFLSVHSGCFGIFLQFLAAVLILGIRQPQLSLLRCFERWDQQQLPSPPSALHTINGLCAQKRMGIPWWCRALAATLCSSLKSSGGIMNLSHCWWGGHNKGGSSLRRDGSVSWCFCFWEQRASRELCRGWHWLMWR